MILCMDLNDALGQFDIVDANLCRLEKVWEEMSELIYDQGPIVGVRDERRYETLRRAFGAIADKLPAIDGSRLDGYPVESDEVAQHQFQAREHGEPEGYIYADQVIYAPSKGLDDYRFRFDSARRDLVRERMGELMKEVDSLLSRLLQWVPESKEPVVDPDWSRLKEVIAEIERLAGDTTPRKGRRSDMGRHLRFGQGLDVHDIANLDWPSVRADIETGMYSELEPLPVEVNDLTTLVRAKPTGPVSTKLAWNMLDAEDFERLLFNIVAKAEGYENARWLTRTNAPDRGRDISVDRVLPDSLTGVTRQRVIVQVKHWLARSIPPIEVTQAVSTMRLLEPPLVNVLILATSGRFTSDAVALMDKHNNDGNRPILEPWPESHLESLLAERPHLVAEFRLRSPRA
jgi:hypothetical protein